MPENRKTALASIFRSLDAGALISIAGIIAAGLLLIFVTGRAFPWLANRMQGRRRLILLASVPMVRLVIIATSLILIVPRVVEPTVQNMVAILGAAGLAIGFALKDWVSSLIAGVVAVHEMPYRPGDWIEVEGAYGEVRAVGIRAVKIVTPDDTVVTIPHLKLWTDLIHNANDGTTDLQCAADFFLDPDHDGLEVESLLRDVALASPFLKLAKPIAVVAAERPWGSHYRLKAYPLEQQQQFRFITDLTVRGKAALRSRGIAFAATPYAATGALPPQSK